MYQGELCYDLKEIIFKDISQNIINSMDADEFPLGYTNTMIAIQNEYSWKS